MPDSTPTHRESFPNDPDSTDTLRTQDLARRRTLIDSREGRVGPYKILETIGEGGFGTVYLAEQIEPIRRRVALKIIKAGMDTKQVIARFEAERQALAMMNHPNVAKVLDAGATDKGRPYFVMEHVPGVRITEHCDRHRLDVKERLDLFLQVCEAVQHAHQKGIIHRDIKPSNILVSVKEGKALPKVIDFGVAKATAGRLTDKTIYTEQGQFIGTPAYMSPEQAEMTAQDIDTRSDIYSLGVLLYELLTGTVPFDPATLREGGPGELQRIIREVEPPKPSTRISTLGSGIRVPEPSPSGGGRPRDVPARRDRGSTLEEIARQRRTDPPALRKLLRGDLDWITMKAMEKDRTRRYASASDFAADIMRHLRDEPVLAGPPSAPYRMKKFVRRNRLAVIAATAVFAALLLGMAATGIALTREAHQRRLVEEQRNRAIEAEKVAATEAETAKQVSEFLVGIFKVSDPSEVRGNAITAREILDKGAQRITTELKDKPVIQATLMGTIGRVYVALGLYDLAQPLLEASLAARRNQFGDQHPQVAESLYQLATLPYIRGDYKQAEQLYRQSLEMRRDLLGSEHLDVADSLNALAVVLMYKGENDEAERLAREGLAIRRKLLGNEHPDVAQSLNDLASVLDWVKKDNEENEEAERLHREALAIRRKVLGNEGVGVAESLNNLALVLKKKGDLDGAEQNLRESLMLVRKLLGNEHTHVATGLLNLGALRISKGDYSSAEQFLREALTMKRKLFGDQTTQVVVPLRTLGECLTKMTRYDEAEQMLIEAYRVGQNAQGAGHPSTIKSAQRLAEFYIAWDAAEPGKGHAEKAAEWRAKLEETKTAP